MFFYSARDALVQDLFPQEQHAIINGFLEIETQFSTFFCALIVFFWIKEDIFANIILICSIAILISVLMSKKMNYVPSKENFTKKKSLKSGLNIFVEHKLLILLSIAVYMPFVTLMMNEIVTVTYLKNVLMADVSTLAITTVTYAIGAMLAGIITAYIIKLTNYHFTLFSALLMTFLTYFIVAKVGTITAIIISKIFIGIGNAMARVTFKTYMMEVIPKNVIGVFVTSTLSFTYMLRTLSGAALGLFIINYGEENALYFLTGLSALGLIAFIQYIIINISMKKEKIS